MQEILSQLVSDVRSALRFRWHGMALTWAAFVVGSLWVGMLPDVYEGSARVYVDTSSILEPILRDQIVVSDVEDQLGYVREALLGRTQLETVVQEVGLGAPGQSIDAQELLLAKLREDIVIDTSGVIGRRNAPENIYTISYRHEDRAKAVGVVDALLDSLVETTLGGAREGGDAAARFLDARVAEYDARLQQAERALADFKKEHADRLPGAEGDYFNRMQEEKEDLEEAIKELRLLESKRGQIVEQLSQQSSLVGSTLTADVELPANSLDARIRDYQAKLDSLLLEYTDRHPDVINTMEALEQLKAQRQEELRALGIEDDDLELAALQTNPVYAALQLSRSETDVEIATMRTDIGQRTNQIDALQKLIEEVPEVEAQLARLNRDYTVIYDQYVELVRSRETQQLTRQASDTDQVDFRIIDPPLASFSPVAPPRLSLLAVVLLGSLAAGAGAAYVLAQLWPVFSTARTLRNFVELPVLGVVTLAWQDRYRAERRKATAAYVSVLACLVAAYAGLAAVEFMGPGLHSLVVG